MAEIKNDSTLNLTLRGRMVSASALAPLRSSGERLRSIGQDDPLVKTEPLAAVIQRTQKEKPKFAKRQQDLLAERYDLAEPPGAGRRRCRAASRCRTACASSCPPA